MTGTSTSTTYGAKRPSQPRRVERRRNSSINSCSRCRRERGRTKCLRYETSRGRNFGVNTDTPSFLHTDEADPHVHLVLKAVSEQGVRLNIKKATLRHWRLEFARNLRQLGVEANATERAVRGETRKAKSDGIYRASLRGESTYARAQAEEIAAHLLQPNTVSSQANARLSRPGA